MIAVQTAHSLLSPPGLAVALDGQFSIPTIDDCGLHRSFINDTYWVRASGQMFYFRVYQAGWRTTAQAAAEMEIVEQLAAFGAAVARPVSRIEGGFVVEVKAAEGPRPAVLLEEAPGDELDYSGEAGLLHAKRYGRAAAALHLASEGLTPTAERPPMDADAMIRRPSVLLSSKLATIGDRAALRALVARLAERIEPNRQLSVGFAHGDLNSSNIHFVGGIGTVIDFDCCGWGWRANDIAAFLRGVTRSRLPGRETSALISAYLEGYCAVGSIGPADLEVLPAFLLVQRLWMASLHIAGQDRWGASAFGAQYLRQLVSWLSAWQPVLDARPDWIR